MQVIPIDSVPVQERPHVREGVFHIQNIIAGEPDTPGNFALMLSAMPDTYESPRHRHNFDQVRYQIEGDLDYARDGRMQPGTIGYFPEATYYGPQTSRSRIVTLVLQFGGASGSGYLSMEQYEQAMQELEQEGSFAKGVFTRVREDGSKVNQDAFEAVWEKVNGRKLVYPEQRYLRPVFMEPEHFDWVAVPGRAGVERKLLGVFSERETRVMLYRLQPGAALEPDDNSLYFIRHGSGRAGDQDYAERTTVYLRSGETGELKAGTETEVLQLGLPRFD